MPKKTTVKVHGSGKLLDTRVETWGTRRFYSSNSITIPKAIAQRLGIGTGDEVRVSEDDGRIVIEKLNGAEEAPK